MAKIAFFKTNFLVISAATLLAVAASPGATDSAGYDKNDLSTDVQQPEIKPRYQVYGGDTIYYMLRDMPRFPGGVENLESFKSANLKIPSGLTDKGFEGNVTVSFLVNKDGKLTEISVTGGLSPAIDAEVIRVVRLMPAWEPGMLDGKPVQTKFSTRFNFFRTPIDPGIPTEVFVVVEEMPRFPGGDSALMKFIYSGIKYPEEARTRGIQGRVITRFCINISGGVDRVSVIKGVDPLLDAEALRVISTLSGWQPGKLHGKPVNVWYSVPVNFEIPGMEHAARKPVQPGQQSPMLTMPRISGYDTPPQFPGGEDALLKFFESSVKYPPEAAQKGISGTVMLRVFIDKTGKPSDISVSSATDPLLVAEALRVARQMPLWEPGKLQGNPVSVTYFLPVNFRLK